MKGASACWKGSRGKKGEQAYEEAFFLKGWAAGESGLRR